jgi:hypothetical protein
MGGTLDAVSRLSEDPGDGFDQILDGCVGLGAITLRQLGQASNARANENSAGTNCLACIEILPAIADHKGALETEVEICGSPAQQPWLRLPAFTSLSIFGDDAVGMVGTMVVRVYARASFRQPIGDEPVGFVDERLRQQTTCDARLVRDDHDREAGAIEQPDRIRRERKEHETIEAIEVSGFLDQCPVAIEEHCGFHFFSLSWGSTRSTPARKKTRAGDPAHDLPALLLFLLAGPHPRSLAFAASRLARAQGCLARAADLPQRAARRSGQSQFAPSSAPLPCSNRRLTDSKTASTVIPFMHR